MIEVGTPGVRPLRNQTYFQSKLANIAGERQDARAKWAKDHPTQPDGTSTRTWKSFTDQRFASDAYRSNYDQIDWGE